MISPLAALEALGAPAIQAEDGTEKLVGYGVVGQPFASGHILALRSFPSTTIGAPYQSVWHRDPKGLWRMWVDAPARQACPRYFGRALVDVQQAPIRAWWSDPWTLNVSVDGGRIVRWKMQMAETRASRLLTWLAAKLPEGSWSRPRVMRSLGWSAGRLLGVGPIALQGHCPNGQWFRIRPSALWMIPEVVARLDGIDLGSPGPVDPQSRLGDLRIPQKGIFVLADTTFEAFDPSKHTRETVGMVPEALVDPSSSRPPDVTRPAGRP